MGCADIIRCGVGVALLAVLAIPLAAAPSAAMAEEIGREYLPPEHWAYDALYRFESLGLTSLPSYKLLTRDAVRRHVRDIRGVAASAAVILSSRDRYQLERLTREFTSEAAGSDPRERYDSPVLWRTDHPLALEGDVDVSLVPRRPVDDPRWEFLGIGRPSVRVHIANRATYEVRYRFTMGPERGSRARDEKPSPREKSFKGLTSLYERSYIVWPWKRFTFFWGRDVVDWGPSAAGNLLISQSAESLDKFGVSIDFRRFHLSTFHATLSAERERRLSAHRLEYRRGRLTLGLAEAVVYAGRGVDPAYTLPIASFYANQFNERTDDNILWTVDAKYVPFDGCLVFGSLLVDDFQFERGDGYPDKIAFDVGGRGAWGGVLPMTVRMRYRFVDIYTYTHGDTVNAFVTGSADPVGNGDPFIGAAQGPDSDELRVSVEWYPRANVVSRAGGAWERRGEGRDFRRFQKGIYDPSPPFPSGIVEKTLSLRHVLVWELDGNSVLEVAVQGVRIENENNRVSDPRWDHGVQVRLTWDF